MSLKEIITCKYFSSVGLMLSLDENDIIIYDKDPNKIIHDFGKLQNGKDGCVIYIKFSFLRHFVNQVLPKINYKFILVTGDGDETIPHDMFHFDEFNNIIKNDKIIHWYSVNCIESVHPKLSLIPIGVNFHSLSFGEFMSSPPQTPLEQEECINKINSFSKPFFERKSKCYSNFHFAFYNKFDNPRRKAIEKIPKELIFYEQQFVERNTTWKNQSEYAFVVSPMGNGMDCHRTWEALMLGCIVIVEKSPLNILYKDLPVLILDDWSQITQELLDNTIEKFKNNSYDYNKLTLKYWVNKIKK
jgi:hypothetical protein